MILFISVWIQVKIFNIVYMIYVYFHLTDSKIDSMYHVCYDVKNNNDVRK